MSKILVIEDDAIIRQTIDRMLSDDKHNIIFAESGYLGVQLAQEQLPDLIICDISMPEFNGYKVLEQLQKNSTTELIPFIFLTAKTEKSDMRRAMDLGADDYLLKPFTTEEIRGAVSARLKRYSSLRERYSTPTQQSQQQDIIYQDSLTKLPNQFALRELFNQTLQKEGMGKGESDLLLPLIFPILCLSLDRLDQINENLGYDFGNLLIKKAAERLQICCGDKSIIVRLNTGEFAIILKSVTNKAEVIQFITTILDTFSKSFFLNEQEVFITPSIGISLYPHDDLELGKLLQYANKAMIQAKQLGGNQHQFYTAVLNIGSSSSDVIALETDLHYALQRDELQVFYQPQINLKENKITGVEAFLRWYHPQRGLVVPDQFIPIAEETGLIKSIGEWVLLTACKQTKFWQENGLDSLRVAVKISARQFNQLDLSQKLVQILGKTHLEAQYLELELTENILVQNAEIAIRRLNALKKLGVKIAVDDFGAGYSYLRYLNQFPLDVLKIDKVFVRDINKNDKNQAILAALISMAHQLGLEVIAEGVETQEEMDFLHKHQCDEMQGYLFSYPVSVSEFEKSPFYLN